MTQTLPSPKLRHICDLFVLLDPIRDMGAGQAGQRRIIPIVGGRVIEIRNYGYRHGPAEVLAAIARGEEVSPDSYYMRTHARLETGDPRYDWVNRTLFVGSGARKAGQVVVSLFALE